MTETAIPGLKLGPDGLIPAVVQSAETEEVLMLGYMNEEALRRTLTEGRVTYWSRSRQEFWRKGDSSGNIQIPVSVSLDCDADTLLVRVKQTGPACHTGSRTCFFTELSVAGHDASEGEK